METRKVCVVTGTRAEYGLLAPLLRVLSSDPGFELQIVAAAAHLSPEFGLTYRDILNDGFRIRASVEMLLSSDSAVGIAKSMALGTISFAEVFEGLRPDLLFVTADRYEMLAAAQAALVAGLPMAHIGGGDVTEGAFDDSIRHSLTKMSALHFPTNPQSAMRIRQMGEDWARIHTVGSLGIDAIRAVTYLSREELVERFGFQLRSKNLLVTFHPVTLAPDYGIGELRELLATLADLGPDYGLIVTGCNADNAGRQFAAEIDHFARQRPNITVHANLGHSAYLSTMALVDAVVGNSSSGIYEAPSLHKPTVDIGERQRGRLRAESVFHCDADRLAIAKAINNALSADCSGVKNPYGDGTAALKILSVLRAGWERNSLLRKSFLWSSQ